MQRSSAFADQGTIERARRALGRRHNWLQLAKFCAVGASGYLVNLAVFTILVGSGLHYLLAATGSFLVAVTNNYIWNRLWTFRGQRGHVAYQGLRFLVVSGVSLGANLVILHVLVQAMDREVSAAGHRDRAGHPAELRREQALVVRAALAALVAGLHARGACSSRDDAQRHGHRAGLRRGRAPDPDAVRAVQRRRAADGSQATRILLRYPKVADVARAVPAEASDRRRISGRDRRMGRESVVGRRGADRARKGRRQHRSREGGLDRAAGGVDDGPGRGGSVRRQDDQRHVAVARVLRGLPSRARGSAQASLAAEPRPARAALRSRSRSGSSTRARSSGAPRLRIHRSSTCSAAASGSPGATGRRAPGRRSGRSGCSPARPSSSAGFGWD